MKTETLPRQLYYFALASSIASLKQAKAEVHPHFKSDLLNHRFAIHDNKSVEDEKYWDQLWFTNYE